MEARGRLTEHFFRVPYLKRSMASLDFWTTNLLPVSNEEWMAAAAGGAAGYLYFARQIRGVLGSVLGSVLKTQQSWQIASGVLGGYLGYKIYVFILSKKSSSA